MTFFNLIPKNIGTLEPQEFDMSDTSEEFNEEQFEQFDKREEPENSEIAEEQEDKFEGDELDNPLRAIIVVNSPDVPEGDMEERLLDSIQSMEDMNSFFDKFDETIAIPNEGHIKYEVGSDGMVVIVVDNLELRNKALIFIDDYVSKDSGEEKEEDRPIKRVRQ